MEVPRLWVQLEIQLLAYAIATATPDLSCICYLHHSSWQYQILNPLSMARDPAYILMDATWVHNLLSYSGKSTRAFLKCHRKK